MNAMKSSKVIHHGTMHGSKQLWTRDENHIKKLRILWTGDDNHIKKLMDMIIKRRHCVPDISSTILDYQHTKKQYYFISISKNPACLATGAGYRGVRPISDRYARIQHAWSPVLGTEGSGLASAAVLCRVAAMP
jgi:hypothetical protein